MSQKRKRDSESEDIDDRERVTKKRKLTEEQEQKREDFHNGIKRYNWFLTWNNYDQEQDKSVKALLAMRHLKAYVIQEEQKEGGVRHLQGCLSFGEKRKFMYLKKKFHSVHWEPVENLAAARNYCQKLDTRVGKTWVVGFKTEPLHNHKVVDPLEGKRLYAYQERIKAIIRGPVDDRKIYWLWSDKGGIGKSALTKSLVLTEDAILVGGTWKDALYAIGERLKKENGWQRIKVILIDIPRSQGNKVSYTGIESIKNGVAFSPKYESSMLVFDIPHVIVFANQEPNQNMLSLDRWVIKNLDGEQDLGHIKTERENYMTHHKFYKPAVRRENRKANN